MSDVWCPFCREGSFDLIGLEDHLESGTCDVFNHTKTLVQEWNCKNAINESQNDNTNSL